MRARSASVAARNFLRRLEVGHLVRADAIAIGGLGSYTGALLGALVLGFAQAFASYYAGSTLADAAPYVLFVLVMLVLPQGILGRRAS